MQVAAVQMSSGEDTSENLQVAERLVREAAGRGARLVCLPEGFAYLGAEVGRRGVAEPLSADSPIQSLLGAWARQLSVHLVAGGMPIVSSDPERPYNSSLLFGPDGQLRARYDKIHLFDVALDDGTVLSESVASLPGDAPVVAAVEGVGLGLSICYDMRFPLLYQEEREMGADVLCITAAFTETTGQAHWHALLRARAIEVQCFVIAAAQVGSHPRGRRTFGHSLVVDPWGTVIAELPREVGVLLADIDPEAVRAVRRQMPVWSHRREL